MLVRNMNRVTVNFSWGYLTTYRYIGELAVMLLYLLLHNACQWASVSNSFKCLSGRLLPSLLPCLIFLWTSVHVNLSSLDNGVLVLAVHHYLLSRVLGQIYGHFQSFTVEDVRFPWEYLWLHQICIWTFWGRSKPLTIKLFLLIGGYIVSSLQLFLLTVGL